MKKRKEKENEEESNPEKLERYPFKKGRIPFIGGKTVNTKNEDKGKLKEPIALVIMDNYDVKTYQNVKPGSITVERDGKDVDILNPKSKILSFDWGGETIRGWIIDVREEVALPTAVTHDSLEIKRTIDAMQTNYKNYQAKQSKIRWEGASKVVLYIGIAIAVIFIALAMADAIGLDVLEILRPAPQVIVDQGTVP